MYILPRLAIAIPISQVRTTKSILFLIVFSTINLLWGETSNIKTDDDTCCQEAINDLSSVANNISQNSNIDNKIYLAFRLDRSDTDIFGKARYSKSYERKKLLQGYKVIITLEKYLSLADKEPIDAAYAKRILEDISTLKWHRIGLKDNKSIQLKYFYSSGDRFIMGVPLIVNINDTIKYVIDLRSDYFQCFIFKDELAKHIVIYKMVYDKEGRLEDSEVFTLERNAKILKEINDLYAKLKIVVSDSSNPGNYWGVLLPEHIAKRGDANKFRTMDMESYRNEYIDRVISETPKWIDTWNKKIQDIENELEKLGEKDDEKKEGLIVSLHTAREARENCEKNFKTCEEFKRNK